MDKSYAWNFCKKKKVIYIEENLTHTTTPHHGVYTFVPAVCYWKSTEHVKIASIQALSKNAYQSVRTLLVMFGEIRSNNEPWDWTWFLVNTCTCGYDTKDIFRNFCLIVDSILSKDSFKFWWQAITQEKLRSSESILWPKEASSWLKWSITQKKDIPWKKKNHKQPLILNVLELHPGSIKRSG